MRLLLPMKTTMTGQILAHIAAAPGPVSTRQISRQFAIRSQLASAILCQLRDKLRDQGRLRQKTRATIGHKAKPATWVLEKAVAKESEK